MNKVHFHDGILHIEVEDIAYRALSLHITNIYHHHYMAKTSLTLSLLSSLSFFHQITFRHRPKRNSSPFTHRDRIHPNTFGTAHNYSDHQYFV